MNILFSSCIYSDNQKDSFLAASRRGYQFAAQNLQESLVCGFLENGVNPNVLSIPSLSSFPAGCRKLFVRDADYIFKEKKLGHCFGYFNVPFLKYRANEDIVRYVDAWYESCQGDKFILVYGLLLQQMYIATEAKKRHPDVKLCVVVPDLPRFMACNKYSKMLGQQDESFRKIESLIPLFDAFVLLSEPMADDLHIKDKPHVVVEGIFSASNRTLGPQKKTRAILYSGLLHSRYGIRDLVDAFMKIEDPELSLWLCGTGDAVEYIEQCSKRDSRIVYYGMVSRDKVIELQKCASLLVNPRHSTEDFTQFSFPSKTLEYMASGTPTLMSRLPSVPAEYEQYMYFFDDESIDGMAAKMKAVCSMSEEELERFGANAAEFIMEKKNPAVQVRKIMDLMCQIK